MPVNGKVQSFIALYQEVREQVQQELPDAPQEEVHELARKIVDFLLRKDDEKYRLTLRRFWLQLASQIIPLIIALVAILRSR